MSGEIAMSFDTTWKHSDAETVRFDYIGMRNGDREYAIYRNEDINYLSLSADDLMTMHKLLSLFISANGIDKESLA